MVAYKNYSCQDKDYQKQNYTLPSKTSIQCNPSNNRLIPANNSIDEVIQSSPTNDHYQKRLEPCREIYDLSQPIWFEEIMKRLAKDSAKKEEKTKHQNNLDYSSLN